MEKEIECTVSGRVQMVMFRDFTERSAQKLSLRGFVENTKEGTVHIVARGEEGKLKNFITLLEKGSLLSKVEKVSVSWSQPTFSEDSFTIRYRNIIDRL